VWEAYKRVKANKGSAGIDEQSLEEFEKDLKNNLYKLWNRMSSGSYFPPPVLLVEIPKKDGGKRPLGIPTVSDRIAQMVVKLVLEPKVEPYFHPDSYGYRPGKSALEAVGVCRKRCWRKDWVLDLDIKGFFDNIRHDLLMRAVRKHTDSKWVLLYVARWLKAAVQNREGKQIAREKGTPQGSVISPLLANLYLHYALDEWLRRHYPLVWFERYADDTVVHGRSRASVEWLKKVIEARLKSCGLELHPEKTRIIYCKDGRRAVDWPVVSFDFLGYTFRPRSARTKAGRMYLNFSPAISQKSKTAIYEKIRKWQLHRRTGHSLQELAELINPVIRGWINYYGEFYRHALYQVFVNLNRILYKWAKRKFKRLKGSLSKAIIWFGRIARQNPRLFAHWELLRVIPTER
jgi:RNA-directed DNA polymerase